MNDLISFDESLIDETNTIDIVFEQISTELQYPTHLKSRRIRQQLFEDCGKVAFIKPDTLEYPIIDPKNRSAVESCTPDCKLLILNYNEIRSNRNKISGAGTLLENIKDLIQQNSCSSKIKIAFESCEEINLDQILFYFR